MRYPYFGVHSVEYRIDDPLESNSTIHEPLKLIQ